MTNRISFYFRQASSNLKRSIMVIISISIIISMVAGILYYMDSYEKTSKINAFNNICDVDILNSDDQAFFSSNLIHNYEGITQAINKSDLDVRYSFEFAFFHIGVSDIYRNFTNNAEAKNLGLRDIENMSFSVFLADSNFYNSDLFSQYFTLYEGKFPSNSSEILMNVNAAKHFNYHVGEKVNLTMTYRANVFTYGFSSIPNIIISGIYYPNIANYSIMNQNYLSPYSNVNIETHNFPMEHFYNSPIFSYNNFSNPENNNPFQIYCNAIFNKVNGFDIPQNALPLQSGIDLVLYKNNIHLYNLKSYNIYIQNKVGILNENLPGIILSYSFLSEKLNYLVSETSTPMYEILIFVVPFLIFAVVIGSFSITNVSTRFDEFLLLKSKGIPKNMVRNQLITEAFLIGLISAISAALLGIIIFYLDKIWLKSLIFYSGISPNVNLYITWSSIGEIFLISMGLAFLTNISGFRTMNKIQFSELLTRMGEDEVKIEYNETSLFGMSKPSYLEEDQEEFNIISRNNDLKSDQNKKKYKNNKNYGIDTIKGNSKYYENNIEKSQKKIPKKSYYLIIFSLIPLILYYITIWSKSPNVPDILLNYSNSFSKWYPYISIFIIITPILMVVGIIRYLSKESPSKFAKISRFLSKPFLKTKSYLVGLEMIKRKKFRTILLIIGIFSSLFVFSNCIFNSTTRYPIIENNLRIGADLKLTADVPGNLVSGHYNTSYTQFIDNNLTKITNNNGIPLFTNVLTYYKVHQPLTDQEVFYFNFTKYVKMLQENNKFIPNNLITELSRVITYNNNHSNSYPGAIVNKNFLTYNQLQIGDLFTINQSVYSPQLGKEIVSPIKVIIVATYEQLPGIDAKSTADYTSNNPKFGYNDIAVDYSILKNENHGNPYLNIFTFNQLIDLNLKASSNDTLIQNSIKNSTKSFVHYDSFSFYNQQWNSPHFAANLNTAGFYSIIYFEFIILGILLAIGLASLLNSFQTENRYYFGILMSRGFGKKGIFNFMISQLIIVFVLAILSGLISGIITSIFFLKFTILGMNLLNLGLPFFISWLNILEILGSIIAICFSVYIITYLFQMRKSISQYMRRF